MGQAERFRQASGQLTVALYKEEIEAILRTPDVAGFQLLGLTDFPGFGPAFIGVLDTLSKSKGLITPEEFRRFCGPTVPLLRLEKRLWSADETLVATARCGALRSSASQRRGGVVASPLSGGRNARIRYAPLSDGDVRRPDTSRYDPHPSAQYSIRRAIFNCAAQYSIECSVGASVNDWDVWVYPERLPFSATGITVAGNWDTSARVALQEGKTVVLLPESQRFGNTVPCSFTTVFWAAAWFPQRHETMGILCEPQHPALKLFATDFHADWQWWELMSKSRAFDLTEGPADLQPIVQVIDDAARSRRLGAVIEARVGRGKLLATSFDLVSDPGNRLAARQLRDSLISYAASPEFAPKSELKLDYLDSLFRNAEP